MADLFQSKSTKAFVEANQVTSETADAVAVWCGGLAITEHDALVHETTYAGINVPTTTGMKRASEGAWIVRAPSGGFYVVSDAVFKEVFEAVKDIPSGNHPGVETSLN